MAHKIFYVNDKEKQEEKKSPILRQVRPEDRVDRASKEARQRRAESKRLMRMSLVLVAFVFLALLYLLNKQSKVLEITAENAKLQYTINELTKENAKRREAMSKNLDLDKIRQEAQQLGLNSPSEKQVIEVPMDQTDQFFIRLARANAQSTNYDEEDRIRRQTRRAKYGLRKSFMLVIIGVLAFSVAITASLYKITVKDHKKYSEMAANTHTARYPIYPARGNIRSADGKDLAISTFTYTVGVTPGIFGPSKNSDYTQAQVEEKVAKILDIDLLLIWWLRKKSPPRKMTNSMPS
jgi:cell division protein FtsL